MARLFLILGAVTAGLAVALGAFAAHALKPMLDDRAQDLWELASRYQLLHALALILVGVLLTQTRLSPALSAATPLVAAGFAFIAGILLFSGSLYSLALTGTRLLGAITPMGGTALLIGWICLTVAAWQWPH